MVYHRFKYWQHRFRGEARPVDGFASVSIARDVSTAQPLYVLIDTADLHRIIAAFKDIANIRV